MSASEPRRKKAVRHEEPRVMKVGRFTVHETATSLRLAAPGELQWLFALVVAIVIIVVASMLAPPDKAIVVASGFSALFGGFVIALFADITLGMRRSRFRKLSRSLELVTKKTNGSLVIDGTSFGLERVSRVCTAKGKRHVGGIGGYDVATYAPIIVLEAADATGKPLVYTLGIYSEADRAIGKELTRALSEKIPSASTRSVELPGEQLTPERVLNILLMIFAPLAFFIAAGQIFPERHNYFWVASVLGILFTTVLALPARKMAAAARDLVIEPLSEATSAEPASDGIDASEAP